MGSFIKDTLIGTAPKANYYLFITEASGYESKVEEINWAKAAEIADSIGVDIINSSLGYTEFDDASTNYTLNQLQIFLKIVQTNSITRAAKELNLTQPAVSIQLKNFQDQFDIALTEVIGRKLYVTDFGREIADTVENIVNQVYAINYKTHAFKGQLYGRLKISVVSSGK
jgi:hypothetical protein